MVLHEHLAILVHQSQGQVLLVDLAISHEVLVLDYLLVLGKVLEAQLSQLFVLLGEDVNALLALLDLVVDIFMLLNKFVTFFFILQLFVFLDFLGMVEFLVELVGVIF